MLLQIQKPELFYLTFALFDARNHQKISENFYTIPNYDIFFSQLAAKSKSNSKLLHGNHKNTVVSPNKHSKASAKTLFSLDGEQTFDNIAALLHSSSFVKQSFLNKIKKVKTSCILN